MGSLLFRVPSKKEAMILRTLHTLPGFIWQDRAKREDVYYEAGVGIKSTFFVPWSPRHFAILLAQIPGHLLQCRDERPRSPAILLLKLDPFTEWPLRGC